MLGGGANCYINNKKSFQAERTVEFAQLQQSPLFTQHVKQENEHAVCLTKQQGEKALRKSSPLLTHLKLQPALQPSTLQWV